MSRKSGISSALIGLHNLDNSSSAEALYGELLANFTDSLIQKVGPKTKLVYVTTAPYMPDRYFGNYVVEDLNRIATGIMSARSESAGETIAVTRRKRRRESQWLCTK